MNKYNRITVQLEEELVEQAKNIVYWEPSLTLKSFIETAIEKQIEIYREVHRGDAPKRPSSKLRAGRPIK